MSTQVTWTVGGIEFAKSDDVDAQVTERWNSTDGKFEFTRQVVWIDEEDEDVTFGFWSVEEDDWAHKPFETGFEHKRDAVAAFLQWLNS